MEEGREVDKRMEDGGYSGGEEKKVRRCVMDYRLGDQVGERIEDRGYRGWRYVLCYLYCRE